MSLHISISNDAERDLILQNRKNTIAGILSSILGAALLGLLLYAIDIIIESKEPPELTVYVPTNEELPPNENPVTPERATARPSSPTPNHASIITSTAASMVAVPTVDVDEPQMADITQSIELGVGFGPSIGTDLGDDSSVWGREEPTGSALEGSFYDFKQTKAHRETGLDPNAVAQLLKEFITKGWNENLFAKYYKSPTKLYASHLFISRRSATEAPKAYKCADKVKDSRWAAIYRGTVLAPKSGKFRFVGAGDDGLVVRFNNKNVFDYGWYQIALGKITTDANYRAAMKGTGEKALQKEIKEGGINIAPVTFYTYSSTPHWNKALGGLAAGATFSVEAGKKYPIEILITELPGGEFGATLLIEEVGAKYDKKDKLGAPIIHLFRTNYGIPEASQNKGEVAPFDPVSPVWEVVK